MRMGRSNLALKLMADVTLSPKWVLVAMQREPTKLHSHQDE